MAPSPGSRTKLMLAPFHAQAIPVRQRSKDEAERRGTDYFESRGMLVDPKLASSPLPGASMLFYRAERLDGLIRTTSPVGSKRITG
jgi:hypothetical protein